MEAEWTLRVTGPEVFPAKGMGKSMRRAWSEALVSGACLTAVLAAIVGIDEHMRSKAALAFSSTHGISEQLAYGGGQVREAAWVVFALLRDQSLDHAPLMIFALAGVVLTLFMLRT
jgi:hypothetical protein